MRDFQKENVERRKKKIYRKVINLDSNNHSHHQVRSEDKCKNLREEIYAEKAEKNGDILR